MHMLDIGLYSDSGEVRHVKGIVISDKIKVTEVDLSHVDESFEIKAVFVNEGEHAYAKIRFDNDSTAWFLENLYKVKDATTRGAISRYFWMSVLDKHMRSPWYVDFIVDQVYTEYVERILMTGLMNLKGLVTAYLPSNLVPKTKERLFFTIKYLIFSGKVDVSPLVDQLFDFIQTPEQMAISLEWLDQGAIPFPWPEEESKGEFQEERKTFKLQTSHKHTIV